MTKQFISITMLSVLTMTTTMTTLTSCGKSKDTKADAATVAQSKTRLQSQTQSAPGPYKGAPTPLSPDGLLSAQPINNNLANNNPTEGAQSVDPASAATLNSATATSDNGITIIEQTQASDSSSLSTGLKSPAAVSTPKINSSVNDLSSDFKLISKTVSAEQQKMNQNLANAISSAKLNRSANGDMSMSLSVIELDNKAHDYSIKVLADGDKMKLSAISSGGDLEFQGGFLKCLDSDGACDMSYAKIKFSGAYTRIIFKNSYADSHFVIYKNPEAPVNANFELWNSYILNKTSGAQVAQRFEGLQASSFEVVNGKSSMELMIMSKDQQTVNLSIPLLVADKGAKLSVPVQKLSGAQQKLSQALSDIKLVANEGLGVLRLMFTFSQNLSDSKIWLDVAPLEKSTMTVAEVHTFEAGLSKF